LDTGTKDKGFLTTTLLLCFGVVNIIELLFLGDGCRDGARIDLFAAGSGDGDGGGRSGDTADVGDFSSSSFDHAPVSDSSVLELEEDCLLSLFALFVAVEGKAFRCSGVALSDPASLIAVGDVDEDSEAVVTGLIVVVTLIDGGMAGTGPSTFLRLKKNDALTVDSNTSDIEGIVKDRFGGDSC